MNTHRIWTLWQELCNTNEIARKIKVKECDVERVIWAEMNKQFIKRKTAKDTPA